MADLKSNENQIEVTLSSNQQIDTTLSAKAELSVQAAAAKELGVTLKSASNVITGSISSVKCVEVGLNPISNVETEELTPQEVLEFRMFPRGADATINGYKAVEILGGENVKIKSELGKITINADDCLERLDELSNLEIDDLLK